MIIQLIIKNTNVIIMLKEALVGTTFRNQCLPDESV